MTLNHIVIRRENGTNRQMTGLELLFSIPQQQANYFFKDF